MEFLYCVILTLINVFIWMMQFNYLMQWRYNLRWFLNQINKNTMDICDIKDKLGMWKK